jgi:hypothetical protein
VIRLALIAAVIAGLAAAAAGAWGVAYKSGRDACRADRAAQEALVREAVAATNVATAEAISRIQIRNTTIRQEVARVLERETVYRDCRHPADSGVRDAINRALAGSEPDPGSVPAADAAKGR